MNRQPHTRSEVRSRAKRGWRNRLPVFLFRWHRRIGACACVFVVWLVISGWLLNHADSLKLPQREIRHGALAHWYGLQVQVPNTAWVSPQHWLVAVDNNALLDGQHWIKDAAAPVGMVQTTEFLVIALRDQLILLDAAGAPVDRLRGEALPLASVTRLGSGCGGMVIAGETSTAEGVLSSADGLTWQPCAQAVTWSSTAPLSAEQIKQLEPLLIPPLSAEKILVDLHSGHFFGRFGPYFVDVVGACLLLLSLSGLWLFLRNPKK